MGKPESDTYFAHALRCSALRRAILRAKDVRGVTRDVGIALTDYVSFTDGYASPSFNRLQDEFGFGRASLGRAVKELDGRFFNIVRVPGKGRNALSKYYPIWPENGSHSETIPQREMVPNRTSNGSKMNTKMVPTGEPELMNKLEKELGGGNDPNDFPPEFLSIVRTYNEAKHAGVSDVGKAFGEYQRIVAQGVSPVRLETAIARFKDKRATENDPKHAPDLCRFLAQSTWIGHEPDWQSFHRAIATGRERWEGERAHQVKTWRKLMGADAPLPGEPGSPFPPELIPEQQDEAA